MTACFLFPGLFGNISEEIVWEMNALWEIVFGGIYFPGNAAFENDSLGNKFPRK